MPRVWQSAQAIVERAVAYGNVTRDEALAQAASLKLKQKRVVVETEAPLNHAWSKKEALMLELVEARDRAVGLE